MDVRNCPKCGKLFTYSNYPICPACKKDEDEKFELLKSYINDNPSCSMIELSENTGVTMKRILKYIKEGRLEISKGMRGELRCESCGEPIDKGRYCNSCVIKINQQVAEVLKSNEPKVEKTETNKGPKMHHKRL